MTRQTHGATAGTWLVAVALLAGCGGEPAGAPAEGSDASDAAPWDAVVSDVMGAFTDAPDTMDAAMLPCDLTSPTAWTPMPATGSKFALSVFHFNMQYVPGGLKGQMPPGTNEPAFDIDNDALEDRIVTESFEPVVEALEDHPTWAFTVEMQGYFLEVLALRHPETLDRLRVLVKKGQVELASWHWSAQLWLAYPAEALVRSHAKLDAELMSRCVPRSGVIFDQEGQFGEGMSALMKQGGWHTALLPKNQRKYQHGESPVAPHYAMRGVRVVVAGEGVNDPQAQATWHFYDDAELWATAKANPYFGWKFEKKTDAIAQRVAGIEGLEKSGYQIASVSTYVSHLEAQSVPQAPLPPMLDGTWQPNSTDNVFRWMGASGLFGDSEQDNSVITAHTNAVFKLRAAELAVVAAEKAGKPIAYAQATLEGAWRHTLLGQVSDALGLNPIPGETAYGLDHATAATEAAQGLLKAYHDVVGGQPCAANLATGELVCAADITRRGAWKSVPLPQGLTVEAYDRTLDVKAFTEANSTASGATRVIVTFGGKVDFPRDVRVSLPFLLDEIVSTRALLDDEVFHLPFAQLSGETYQLPVPLGLVQIGPKRWLLQDVRYVHLAVRISNEVATVSFTETAAPINGGEWRFYVLDDADDADALDFARALNRHPPIFF